MNATGVGVNVALEAGVSASVLVPFGSYRHLHGNMGVYAFRDPEDDRKFSVVLSTAFADTDDGDAVGIHNMRSIVFSLEGDQGSYLNVEAHDKDTMNSTGRGRGAAATVQLTAEDGGDHILPGRFKVFRFVLGHPTMSPYSDPQFTQDPLGFSANEMLALSVAIDQHRPLTKLGFYGVNYGWANPLGVANVGGSAGGSGISPDFGARKHRGFTLLQSDLSMERNSIMVVNKQGVPQFVPSRTSLNFSMNSRETWAPFQFEVKVDPWYSVWRPILAVGADFPAAYPVPDDGQHFCRAFGPALAAYEKHNDPAALLYLAGLAQNVLSVYSGPRMRAFRFGPRGSLGREFGWVSHFMARFGILLTTTTAPNAASVFLESGLTRRILNWCTSAAQVFEYQQLPSGAFQALTFPTPGMNPDPWLVDGVPTDATLAQGIEHAILLVGASSVSLIVPGLSAVVSRGAQLYADVANPGAHWFQVGRAVHGSMTWFTAAYSRPEGNPNWTNVPWGYAAGARAGNAWALEQAKVTLRAADYVARPDLYYVKRMLEGL